ncbi:DUF4194 domain-containing protein [Gordonia desulfuricans]|uniref:DUF4194 domain-containing protein n=1 Tax=Gordonia desulfuricans TaxID=89051 RepID=A0A7K3LP47_9ACTN|nr:DUF4194 domain-containing protein [Gordonia desulfuricans]NDK90009.1 DUF4194 domain-containing protein [Gordonia desulfuricans]
MTSALGDRAPAVPPVPDEFTGYDDLPAVARGSGDDGPRTPRFDGDVSAMPDRACWALQNLLARRYVSGDRTPQLWAWVIEYQELLRIRLSELDLRLRLATELEVAFVEQVGYDSRWGRRLLKRETIQTYDAILALHLAKHVRAAREERVLITTEEIHELFAGVSNTIDRDLALFDKRIDKAIDKLEEIEILRRHRDDPDTFTVSPAITAIMTASVITDLQRQFEQFIGSGEEPADADPGGDGGRSVGVDGEGHVGDDDYRDPGSSGTDTAGTHHADTDDDDDTDDADEGDEW